MSMLRIYFNNHTKATISCYIVSYSISSIAARFFPRIGQLVENFPIIRTDVFI